MKTGETEIPEEKRSKVTKAIKNMEWQRVPCDVGMSPGMAIKEVIKQFSIPGVSHIAISNEMAPYGFYGIRGHYKNGTAQLYVLDTGTSIVPIVSDFFPKKEAE